MGLLPAVINGLLIVAVGVILTWVTRTQHDDLRRELKGEIGELKNDLREFKVEIRAELKSEVAVLRSEIASLRSEVRAEIDSVRSDLTQIALAVGAKLRPQAG